MLISDKLKLGFVQIPKTGSSVLKRLILEKDPLAFGTTHRHDKLTKEIADQYSEYLKIIVVRNTYERLSSWYRFESLIRLRTSLSFKRWLLDVIERYKNGLMPLACPFQLDYFLCEGKPLVDKIIPYENLNQEVKNLLGVDLPKKDIDGKFFGDYDHYEIYQHRENIQAVNKYYKDEFDYFNWKMM